jgi:hypothetical protein
MTSCVQQSIAVTVNSLVLYLRQRLQKEIKNEMLRREHRKYDQN